MSRQDNIEKLILRNLKELNEDVPSEGHFERFEERLKQQNSRKKKLTFDLVWKIAAAAVFAFLLVNQAVMWLSKEPAALETAATYSELTLADVSPDYEEVEFYYTNAIHVGLNQWETLVKQGLISKEEQQMLNNELEEFENVYKKLQGDLSVSPNDERVIQ